MLIRTHVELDSSLLVISLDGVGAYDHIFRSSMLQKLYSDESLRPLLPFVRMFYEHTTTFVWTDDHGTTHDIHQGEGGIQGDPLMPALYSLAQHDALEHASSSLPDEVFFVCVSGRLVYSHAGGACASGIRYSDDVCSERGWCTD